MTHGDRSRESLKALANWRITGSVPMSSGKMISRTDPVITALFNVSIRGTYLQILLEYLKLIWEY